MKQEIKEMMINGVPYVPKDSIMNEPAEKLNGLDCVIIRTYSAGVHFGYLKERNGKEVTLLNTRRVYYWDGAASLSQMALEGVSKPDNCKFTVQLDKIELTEAIEVLPITEKARVNLYAVPEWRK